MNIDGDIEYVTDDEDRNYCPLVTIEEQGEGTFKLLAAKSPNKLIVERVAGTLHKVRHPDGTSNTKQLVDEMLKDGFVELPPDGKPRKSPPFQFAHIKTLTEHVRIERERKGKLGRQ